MVVYRFSSPAEFAEKRELIRMTIKEICQEKQELLYVALNEAVNNAFFHGYKGAGPGPVEVMLYQQQQDIVISVRHDGQGLNSVQFPPKRRCSLMADHGRGLEIIKKCTDFCEYNEDGREVIMKKRILTTNCS